MRKFLQYFQQMSWFSLGSIVLPIFIIIGLLIFRQINTQNHEFVGLFQGYFCAPDPGPEEKSYVLKSLHLAPLFASRCSDGRIELDSDLDGLCDRDESQNGSAIDNSFSQHPFISDRVWSSIDSEDRQKIATMGSDCNNRDQDADLLNNCEELLLHSKRYEALSKDQTESLYQLASLNINHPDTDEDGFIDGVELRLVNQVAPFIFSNEESGVDEADSLLNHWLDDNKTSGIDILVEALRDRPGCFSYEVRGLNTWLPQLEDFELIEGVEKGVKLDFIIYALLSTEEEPDRSNLYATRILSAEFKEGKLIDIPFLGGFEFKEIQRESK